MLKQNPILAVFFLVALAFMAGGAWMIQTNFKVASWPPMPVTVAESRVVQLREGEYTGMVEVVFGADKRKQMQVGFSSASLSLIESALAPYPKGQEIHLAVNPEDPDDLRFRPEGFLNAWLLPTALIGGGALFILIPLGALAFSRRSDCIQGVGWTFAGVGLLFLALGTGLGYHKMQVLRTWPEVEGTVAESRVESRLNSKGRYHGLKLVFTYTVEGRSYRTATGSTGTTSSVADQEAKVRGDYAPGTRHRIRYLPRDPGVISFEASWSLGFLWECVLAAALGFVTLAMGVSIARFLR